MKETFKAILIDTGDFILCTTDDINFRKKTTLVKNPVAVTVHDFIKDDVMYETLVLKPWFPCCEEEEQIIQTSKIVSFSEVENPLWIKQYDTFLKTQKEKKKTMADYEEDDVDMDLDTIDYVASNSLEDFLKHMEEKYGTKPESGKN